jgi:hypothetical protein
MLVVGETIEEALTSKAQTEALLLIGGFQLNKWTGSRAALCREIMSNYFRISEE